MSTKRERKIAEARDHLLLTISPGDTLYTVLRHVARSGMLRHIDVYVLKSRHDGIWRPVYLSGRVATVLERSRAKDGSIKEAGCGMDAGFNIVYSLSQALFAHGFECIGDHCPSSDHSNGDRDYTPHHHDSGGYALRHEWI